MNCLIIHDIGHKIFTVLVSWCWWTSAIVSHLCSVSFDVFLFWSSVIEIEPWIQGMIRALKDCDHESEKGVKIWNGGVIREKETTVQICVDGKIKYKKKEEVDRGYPLWWPKKWQDYPILQNLSFTRPRDTGEGRDCLWYGTTFCDGDLIEVGGKHRICRNLTMRAFEDLERWPGYNMRCSGGVMRVVSRARHIRRP